MVGPAPCCELDVVKTWAASAFQPLTVNPGRSALVAVHLLMTNCNGSLGGFVGIDHLDANYTVLVFPIRRL